ncbi:hypothetical protein G6F42_019420 [Rhizopus arrhizus]|nr:hypothetical protein G6F42_019420 [Rhizopus arrhizus]
MAVESLPNLVHSHGHFNNECAKRNSNLYSLNEQVDDTGASLNWYDVNFDNEPFFTKKARKKQSNTKPTTAATSVAPVSPQASSSQYCQQLSQQQIQSDQQKQRYPQHQNINLRQLVKYGDRLTQLEPTHSTISSNTISTYYASSATDKATVSAQNNAISRNHFSDSRSSFEPSTKEFIKTQQQQ